MRGPDSPNQPWTTAPHPSPRVHSGAHNPRHSNNPSNTHPPASRERERPAFCAPRSNRALLLLPAMAGRSVIDEVDDDEGSPLCEQTKTTSPTSEPPSSLGGASAPASLPPSPHQQSRVARATGLLRTRPSTTPTHRNQPHLVRTPKACKSVAGGWRSAAKPPPGRDPNDTPAGRRPARDS